MVLAASVFLAAAVLPLALETVWRADTSPGLHAQSEIIVTEEAAKSVGRGQDPYAATYLHGPLEARPLPTKTHFPYLPGMLVFGAPRAFDGSSPWADARVWFLIVSVAVFLFALSRTPIAADDRLLVAQMAVVLPTGALLATGGDDVPVVALMFMALVLLPDRPGWAGVVGGLAAAVKQTAWPLLPFLVAASARRRRTATAIGLTALPVLLPFVVWSPRAFFEDAIKFPLGLGTGSTAAGTTAAGTPTAGSWLASVAPAGPVVAAMVLFGAVAAIAAWRLLRPGEVGPGRASRDAAIVWAAALVLAPAARVGYLIYPINLLVWSVAFRGIEPRAGRPIQPLGPSAGMEQRQSGRRASVEG